MNFFSFRRQSPFPSLDSSPLPAFALRHFAAHPRVGLSARPRIRCAWLTFFTFQIITKHGLQKWHYARYSGVILHPETSTPGARGVP